MADKAESLIHDLDKVAKARQEFAGYLQDIAGTLTETEQIGETASGKLGLESTIEDLELVSRNLSEDVVILMKPFPSTPLQAFVLY
ncbi:hypothetical protein [Leptolyngbya sp. 7M]|uniref:hypothetical protein n=1 Tax=Leptolyngbya sp. 7M TaxID=2812896 RepID=UPI001B8C81D5|nr:hypothetical protein [Leptolyngbya sp. 7M]QYO63980.1 hypothetical protein JVX88_29980 [Leptolyngbya sp. 7M]